MERAWRAEQTSLSNDLLDFSEEIRMWPFKPKRNTEHRDDRDDRDDCNAAIERLREFRNVGDTFNYLGRTMIVTGHTDVVFGPPGLSVWPSLKCDYANELGEIKQCSFSPAELPGLIKQQERSNT